MTKNEFLKKLREALGQDLSAQKVQENMDYYNQYISDEMRNGKTEQEVIDMLGDPWMIARTIIDTQGTDAGAENYEYEERQNVYQRQNNGEGSVHSYFLDTWWKKLLLILCIVGIICIIFAVITGIISLIAPIAIPVLIIMIVIRIFSGRRN